MSPFKRVLVANRGEIALRIIRACHEEGLEAVAVYSAADRLSPHVRAAAAAVAVGPAPAAGSYPHGGQLIAAPPPAGRPAPHPRGGVLAAPRPLRGAGARAERGRQGVGGGRRLSREVPGAPPPH